MSAPNKSQRAAILSLLIGRVATAASIPANHVTIDIDGAASESDGYTAADLSRLVERAALSALQRCGHVTDGLSMSDEDVLAARDGFTPASMVGVGLQASGVSWGDIGGTKVNI